MGFDRLAGRAAAFLRDAAALALAFMMVLTCADLVLRWTIDKPIFGAFELVTLGLVTAVFLGLPDVFAREGHITVNVLDEIMPRAVVRGVRVVGAVASLAFVALVGVYMVKPAGDALAFGDQTMDLAMPVIWFWVPVFCGVIASVVVCIAVAVRSLRRGGSA
jgi:TRAP-type C4-dicarboxylate transport system permease small subunit